MRIQGIEKNNTVSIFQHLRQYGKSPSNTTLGKLSKFIVGKILQLAKTTYFVAKRIFDKLKKDNFSGNKEIPLDAPTTHHQISCKPKKNAESFAQKVDKFQNIINQNQSPHPSTFSHPVVDENEKDKNDKIIDTNSDKFTLSKDPFDNIPTSAPVEKIHNLKTLHGYPVLTKEEAYAHAINLSFFDFFFRFDEVSARFFQVEHDPTLQEKIKETPVFHSPLEEIDWTNSQKLPMSFSVFQFDERSKKIIQVTKTESRFRKTPIEPKLLPKKTALYPNKIPKQISKTALWANMFMANGIKEEEVCAFSIAMNEGDYFIRFDECSDQFIRVEKRGRRLIQEVIQTMKPEYAIDQLPNREPIFCFDPTNGTFTKLHKKNGTIEAFIFPFLQSPDLQPIFINKLQDLSCTKHKNLIFQTFDILKANPCAIKDQSISLIIPSKNDSDTFYIEEFLPCGRRLKHAVHPGSNMIIVSKQTIDGTEDYEYFYSIDDLLSAFQCSSPPVEKLRKANNHNTFAQIFGLRGFIPVGEDYFLAKEGSIPAIVFEVLSKEIEEMKLPDFLKFNVFMNSSQKKAILQSIHRAKEVNQLKNTTCLRRYKAIGSKLLQSIEKGEPLLISSGFNKHATYITYLNGILAYTNRGFRSPGTKPGTHYFSVAPEPFKKRLLDDQFVRQLIGDCDIHEFLQFTPRVCDDKNIGGELLEALGENVAYLGLDQKAEQKVGNCEFANFISSMHCLVTSMLLSEGEDPLKFAEELRIQYKAFTFELRTNYIKKVAETCTNDDIELINDLMTAITKMENKFSTLKERDDYKKYSHQFIPLLQHYEKKINSLREFTTHNFSVTY